MIDPVRGMRDVAPADFRIQRQVAARIEQTIRRYGYQAIDMPIIEHRDLYLRKLGEELVGKVYEFTFNGRDLVLRPEWTASVLRAYLRSMQEQPLPVRLSYCGPVFRNERPQRHTYRQFMQLGGELIGAAAPRGDAECLALACAGLHAVGIEDYQIRIGHIGLIRTVLAGLDLNERTQSVLAWSMERMRKHGPHAIREQLQAMQSDDSALNAELVAGLDDAQAETLLLHALRTIGVNLQFGTRPPEEIVGRLVRKLRRSDSQSQIERALAFLSELSMIEGAPAVALPAAQALLESFGLSVAAIDELWAILRLAEAHGISSERISLDFGLGRGLSYYTGLIFEIYTSDGQLQLCGGGRYDDLVSTLGGRQPMPAIGFSYGLERVVAASSLPEETGVPEVLVACSDDATYPYALQVAQRLRRNGWVVHVDVRGRNVASNGRDAERRQVAAFALVGVAEQQHGIVRWRTLPGREEHVIAIADLPQVTESDQ
jgi:histidyl-tRNA synthetase